MSCLVFEASLSSLLGFLDTDSRTITMSNPPMPARNRFPQFTSRPNTLNLPHHAHRLWNPFRDLPYAGLRTTYPAAVGVDRGAEGGGGGGAVPAARPADGGGAKGRFGRAEGAANPADGGGGAKGLFGAAEPVGCGGAEDGGSGGGDAKGFFGGAKLAGGGDAEGGGGGAKGFFGGSDGTKAPAPTGTPPTAR